MNINVARVESVYDDSNGLRISARIIHDKKETVEQAFPLLPKTFQTVPKVGEAVLVLYAQSNNVDSQRYYIGPIISQPQYMEKDNFDFSVNSTATSLLKNSVKTPLPNINAYFSTDGAFPETNDVALVGRHSEDIILKDGEIDLRCGIRSKYEGNDGEDKGLVGDVIFNAQNPAYIQMKYRKQHNKESVINLVADRINLMSHKDDVGKLTNASTSTDSRVNEHLINDYEMDIIINKLHPLPYGDVLVDVLEKMRTALSTHQHPFPGSPPISTHLNPLATNYNDILSDNIKIS